MRANAAHHIVGIFLARHVVFGIHVVGIGINGHFRVDHHIFAVWIMQHHVGNHAAPTFFVQHDVSLLVGNGLLHVVVDAHAQALTLQ